MDEIRSRIRETLQRAGLSHLPPSVIVAALAIALVGIVLGLRQWWPRSEGITPSQGTTTAAATPAGGVDSSPAEKGTSAAGAIPEPTAGSEATSTGDSLIYVHVVGAVRRPGLYELPADARVADAVTKAGGVLGNAADRGLNLARTLADGEQLVVPTQDEFERDPTLGGQDQSPAGPGSQAAPSPSATAAGRVNVNTADAAGLDTLPGVGPSTAEKIIAEREANGPFASVDDLARVPGIGPKKLEGLRDLVVTQ